MFFYTKLRISFTVYLTRQKGTILELDDLSNKYEEV